MPCNCIVDKPTYPQNEEWGPLLWWILHTFAEKAGRQPDPLLRADEGRAWPLFVKELTQILPCPYCRDHLEEYSKQHPFVLPENQYMWKIYIPDYFYDLHEAVNQRLGKPSFPKESLQASYRSTGPFKEKLDALTKIVERAVKMGGVSLFSWRAWLKQATFLRATLF